MYCIFNKLDIIITLFNHNSVVLIYFGLMLKKVIKENILELLSSKRDKCNSY